VIPFSAWIVGVILGALNVKLWPAFSVKINFFVCKEDKCFDSVMNVRIRFIADLARTIFGVAVMREEYRKNK